MVKAPPTYTSYSNGNGSKSNSLSLIIASLAIVLALIQGFWSIADPRGNLAKLESKFDYYITIREYEENKRNSFRVRDDLIKDIEILRRDFEKLREAVTGSVTIKDTLKDLQDKIDKLRDKVLVPKTDVKETK